MRQSGLLYVFVSLRGVFVSLSVRQSGILYVFISLGETKWNVVCFYESECEIKWEFCMFLRV